MKKFDKVVEELKEDNETVTHSLSCRTFMSRVYGAAIGLPCDYARINCHECLKRALSKLNEEYIEPVRLTKNEKAILESISDKYGWIVRDINDSLNLYSKKPIKDGIVWRVDEKDRKNYSWVGFCVFNHLFQWVEWEDEEPYNIQEVLNNCEVIEDE